MKKARFMIVVVMVMFVICNTGVQAVEIEWVTISEPDFTGQMSKYETTNAQYCEFLNDALASGDIAVSNNDVIGANGSNNGADFAGQLYYDGDGQGNTYNGATNGGAARINYSVGLFSVDSSFENHPVTYVSWYGVTAFCNYYGYRLPTEWEWEAVADYDGTWGSPAYGCGPIINNSITNFYGSTHPYGTTVVGSFGTYGYGIADMAGNALEWTSSLWNPDSNDRVVRGGGWQSIAYGCDVSYRYYNSPTPGQTIGFRAVRSAEPACGFSDDFEDGVIDTSLWVTGGGKRGWQMHPPGDGNWSWSWDEIDNPNDGYLSGRVWGPTSGNSYGADAWVRTVENFNDGEPHLVNFTWEPDFIDYHYSNRSGP